MEFFDALVRYEVALWSAVDHQLTRHGQVHLGQLHALRFLDRHGGGARVQDLSDELGITVGAASKLVDRLERDGLAARRPNPSDRRSSLIALAQEGERALSSGMQVFQATLARAIEAEDVAPLTAALQRLQVSLITSGVGAAA